MADALQLATRWTAMWNRTIPAIEVVTEGCSVYFGRQPVSARPATTQGPAALQGVIDDIAARVEGIAYDFAGTVLAQANNDGKGGIITLLWEVSAPTMAARSGIDLLAYRDDRITEVWSITGDLPLPPLPHRGPTAMAS